MRDTGTGEMSENRRSQVGGGNRESVLENKGQYCFRTMRDQVGRPREEIDKGHGLIQRSN